MTEKTEDRKIQQIKQRQKQSDYLLYSLVVVTTLLLLESVIFFTIKVNVTLIEGTIQNADKQKKEEECPLQPTTIVIANPIEKDNNQPMYPKLKIDF